MEPAADRTLWRLSHLLLLLALLIGGVVRFIGLGQWPLAVDEYYFFRAIENLLAHGLPRFECGGFYTRGLLQQYLTAPLLLWGVPTEWAMRILPVLFNLLGIPAVYLLGRRLGGFPVGCAAAALFALSVWEIEFARFARMYALFQTLFLWQLELLARTVLDQSRRAPYLMCLLSALALFVYEGAILVILLGFLPFLFGRRHFSIGRLAANLALVAGAVLMLKIDFRRLGAGFFLPEEAVVQAAANTASLPVTLPPLLLGTMDVSAWWPALSGLCLLVGWALLRLWRAAKPVPASERLTWTLVVLAAVGNLFGLALEIFLFAFLFGLAGAASAPGRTCHLPEPVRPALLAIGACLLFWTGYAWLVPDWQQVYGNPRLDLYRNMIGVLLKYPDFYYRMLVQWFEAMPRTTMLLLLVLGAGGLELLLRPARREALHLLSGAVLFLLWVIGVLQTGHWSTRYTFFLYPALLLLACGFLYRLSGRLGVGSRWRAALLYTAVLALMVPAEDFSAGHLRHIASAEVNFRTIYSWERQGQLYRRNDFRTPATFINEHRAPQDLVVSTVPVVDHYLARLDYRFVSREHDGRFYLISACEGKRELWSNRPLLYREDDLLRLIETGDLPVWLIIYSDRRPSRTLEEQHLAERYRDHLSHTSVDGVLQVFRIPSRQEMAEGLMPVAARQKEIPRPN